MSNYTVTFIDTSDDHAVGVSVTAQSSDSAIAIGRKVLKAHGYDARLPLYSVRSHMKGSL